ncbi:hypothetical protein [Novosphingobium sp.]|uniref:hypothetical protein n=1 Tax=Novosphingobium sp. TaxID=1874826 RepID=UPI0026389D89|nr:hypothetical protein [Novosphingobium sp.]
MSAQHTPGPWFQGPQSANGWHTVRVEDVGCTNGRIVAETVEPEDARAIAALPELIQTMEELLRYEGHHVYCGHGDDMDKPCVCGLIAKQDRARAALCKAKGEAA